MKVEVEDSLGELATQPFTLTVEDINLVLPKTPVLVGTPVSIQVTATNNATISLTVEGTPLTLDGSGNASWLAQTTGWFQVVARAVYPEGDWVQASGTIVVVDPSNLSNDPPVVDLTTPADGDVVTAPTNVYGSGLQRFES